MNDQMLRDLLRRLNVLERTSARVRVGEVTGTGPTDVALGGASTSYEDVAALGGPTLTTGDQVAALVWGNDLLVLGAISGLRTVRGTVSSTGAIVEGAGFTVTKGAPGVYAITFNPAFADAPAVVAGAGASGGAYMAKVSPQPTTAGFGIIAFTTAAANLDAEFHFVAVGPA